MNVIRWLPRFRAARKSIQNQLHDRHGTRKQIEERQLDSVNETWRVAWQTTKHYRSVKESLSLPERFDSLLEFQERMPILGKETVRDFRDRFLSTEAVNGSWQRTGGSTGIPTSVFWSNDSHLDNLRRRYAWLSMFNVDFLDRHAMLWGHAGSFAQGLTGVLARYRRPMEDRLRGRLRLSAYNLGEKSLNSFLDRLERYRPKYLYGYSSAVALLAAHASQVRRTIDSLKLVVMTGEPASQVYKDQVARAFNCPGQIEYGSVECGIIGLEAPEQRIEIQESARMVETVRRSDGLFDIIVTVLDNPSFPLLRYRIGDVTSESITRPEKGYATISNIHGRNNDYLVARDGELIHANALKHVIEQEKKIGRFQAKQNENGRIEILIESSLPMSDGELVTIQRTIDHLTGQPDSQIKRVSRIQGNLAGKHRWVISELFEGVKHSQ